MVARPSREKSRTRSMPCVRVPGGPFRPRAPTPDHADTRADHAADHDRERRPHVSPCPDPSVQSHPGVGRDPDRATPAHQPNRPRPLAGALVPGVRPMRGWCAAGARSAPKPKIRGWTIPPLADVEPRVRRPAGDAMDDDPSCVWAQRPTNPQSGWSLISVEVATAAGAHPDQPGYRLRRPAPIVGASGSHHATGTTEGRWVEAGEDIRAVRQRQCRTTGPETGPDATTVTTRVPRMSGPRQNKWRAGATWNRGSPKGRRPTPIGPRQGCRGGRRCLT